MQIKFTDNYELKAMHWRCVTTLLRTTNCQLRTATTLIVALLLLPNLLFAAPDNQENPPQPVLLLEPSFFHAPISDLIPGAERTVIVPALMKEEEGKPATISFLQPSWQTSRHPFMKRFIEKARGTLSETLTTLHPKFLRDEHQVIQVAIIESSNPITASTILAPNFTEQFVSIFGPEFLIAVPTANRIYVFSKLASPLNTLAPMIRDDYRLSASPLSTEIFELSHGQLRAVGSLD